MTISIRRTVSVLSVLLLLGGAGVALAGESEMLSPLLTGNVWTAGKQSLTIWGGRGDTAVNHYDDNDWSFGARFSYPAFEKLNVEASVSYFDRKTDLRSSLLVLDIDDDSQWHDIAFSNDNQKETSLAVSVGGLYTLAADADSPIRGGLQFGLAYSQDKIEQNSLSYDDMIVDTEDTVLEDFPFHYGSFTAYKSSNFTARVALTADIHVIRDKLRVTPSVGYYYEFSSISDDFETMYMRNDESCSYVWTLVDRTKSQTVPCDGTTLKGKDSDHGGGASYGLEVGYRPGGQDGRWEVVLSPYFRSQFRQLGSARKLRDHRNAITLMFRWFM